MESFGNYPRDRPFDPFSVMLFKALQVVAFLFFIALLVMNPEAKQGKIDTKAEFIITLGWPDSHPDDIDLYTEDPLGNIVWYHEREAGFMVLDRDDRGGLNNSITVNGRKVMSPIRQETISIRDRKSTRLNSSHRCISYAVFCLKKKNTNKISSSSSSTL